MRDDKAKCVFTSVCGLWMTKIKISFRLLGEIIYIDFLNQFTNNHAFADSVISGARLTESNRQIELV